MMKRGSMILLAGLLLAALAGCGREASLPTPTAAPIPTPPVPRAPASDAGGETAEPVAPPAQIIFEDGDYAAFLDLLRLSGDELAAALEEQGWDMNGVTTRQDVEEVADCIAEAPFPFLPEAALTDLIFFPERQRLLVRYAMEKGPVFIFDIPPYGAEQTPYQEPEPQELETEGLDGRWIPVQETAQEEALYFTVYVNDVPI